MITYDFEIVKVFRVFRNGSSFSWLTKKKCQAYHYFSNVLHSASMEIQNDSGGEKMLKRWSDENDENDN